MRPTFFDELVRFRTARMWQHSIEQTPDLETIEVEFLALLQRYILDLRYRLGFVEPYSDDLHRLAELKTIARGLGPLYQSFAEYAEAAGCIPSAAQSLLDWLNSVSLDLAYRITHIEEAHPEMQRKFRVERAQYASSLN